MNLGIEFIPSIPLAPRAYEISSAARIGVYDCVYLALAERDVIDFITADDKLIKSMKSQFPCLVSLESRT